jgi:hypothetical protein
MSANVIRTFCLAALIAFGACVPEFAAAQDPEPSGGTRWP